MQEFLSDLLELSIPVRDDTIVLSRGMQIAEQLDHHLFDTLYHAVALEGDATLVTADQRYWKKSRQLGGIILLADWDL